MDDGAGILALSMHAPTTCDWVLCIPNAQPSSGAQPHLMSVSSLRIYSNRHKGGVSI